MANNVISILPQLMCGKLSRELDKYINSGPSASPQEMLKWCNEIMEEIGAVKNANGVWELPPTVSAPQNRE